MGERPSPVPWLEANHLLREVSLERVLTRYGIFQTLKGTGLKRRGLSPFRDERTPSFSVDLRKGYWNDFPRPMIGDKEVPGNVIGLVMALEDCGFRQALVRLHEQFVDVGGPEARSTRQRAKEALSGPRVWQRGGHRVEDQRQSRQHFNRGQALGSAVATATHISTGLLQAAVPEAPTQNIPFGKELRGLRHADVPYLTQKGLTEKHARFWGVGYCSRGMMKGRVVVPIKDRDGVIVGYAGRSLKDDDENGKWRFPTGMIKSLEVFNIDKVALDKESSRAAKRYGLIVVEGFFDAIMLWERGFKNVVSIMGTEISQAQEDVLLDPTLNPTQKLTLFFDGDEPGRLARKKAAAKLIHKSFIRYVDLSRVEAGGRTDPDKFGKEELQQLLLLNRVGQLT